VTQLCDQALAPLDLRAIQLSMLREIDWLGPIALNPLAEAMAMDRATLGHNIRSLEMRGLVRLAASADLRSRQVTLTPKGHVPLARAWKLWRKARTVFEQGIGGAASATLRSPLHRMATQFSLAYASASRIGQMSRPRPGSW
jgi:DNA-binding MarR family transcriptional regulator